MSVIGTISLQGMITHFGVMGSVDKLTFEAFIACKLVPKRWVRACVFVDSRILIKLSLSRLHTFN